MKIFKGVGNGCGSATGEVILNITNELKENKQYIFFCNNFTPDLLIHANKISGVIVRYGGTSSHGYILLRQIHKPCVCMQGGMFDIQNIKECTVNSNTGDLIVYD